MSDRTITTDLLVVGLGPAGSRAARAAALEDMPVIAIDRRSRPGFPVQCAEFIPALMGQEIAGLHAVTRQFIHTMATYVEKDAPDLSENFRGRMVDRGEFDRVLVKAALEAGADCRFGLQLNDLAADGTATLSDGSVIRPRFIIGADGPRSAIGSAIGHVNAELLETRQISVALLKPHVATDVFLSADIIGGYGWLFPRGEIANIGLGVLPGERLRLKPLLEALHGKLAAEGRVGRGVMGHTGGAIPVGGMLDPVGMLGDVPVLLAGDAAGLANPVSGAGINSAVLSGNLAGEAAAAWLAGNGDGLEDYAQELEALFGASIARALRRRRAIMRKYEKGSGPSPADLRAGWIAYPEYWADEEAAGKTLEIME
jgi:geranylgeranyl reductase family protein